MWWWLSYRWFQHRPLKCLWKLSNWGKTLMKSWALPPWRTVSVLSTVVGLPCWSRHCCFLYWPLLWTASSPLPCCHPGCLGQSLETPVVLGGTGGEEGQERQSNDGHRVSTWEAKTGPNSSVVSPWNATFDVIIKCHSLKKWEKLLFVYFHLWQTASLWHGLIKWEAISQAFYSFLRSVLGKQTWHKIMKSHFCPHRSKMTKIEQTGQQAENIQSS